MIETWLTRELGLEVPILGAPMGGRAGGRLAAEVTKAGGLGMLGAAGYATPEWIETESAVAKSAGDFGAGFMVWSLDQDDTALDLVLAQSPRIVSLSFGDPALYVRRVHEAGALVASQINDLDDLAVVEAAGVDIVIAQGAEAGGHTGHVATLPLLQEVLDATTRPVLAAGGIGTGRGLAAVLAAGAQGALVGTALLASPETVGPEYARGKLVAARSTDTVYTSVFDRARNIAWPQRWGGRALANDFSRRWHGAQSFDGIEADYDGSDSDLGVVYAGQIAGTVTAERPVADVVRALASDAEALLRRFA
ncbi:nitronate monooxygenase [Rhodococcus sp. HNM0569]|uniref:NAD(P)H-dependent flavin oxidoreductase n=1 Tax=Rhodococcus sp. HNM0569 TaxID=2716340 RepID=UPI00146CB4C6|nr:nitronate monooxygenase [Rhodococcus sp. HNM0569]NLU84055.1 nitronate monooxygenase [Rhodococcus sp. HNM0569]